MLLRNKVSSEARLAGQRARGAFLHPATLGLQTSTALLDILPEWGLNLDPSACRARTVSPEPCPRFMSSEDEKRHLDVK